MMIKISPPWERLSELISAGSSPGLIAFIDSLSPSETARAISRLKGEERLRLFGLLNPVDAADVIEDIPDEQAADLVEDMPSEQAAAIMEELPSDHLVDVLGEMDADASRAILARMGSEDAAEARKLLSYESDCAAGLMISEFLVYEADNTIQDVLDDLQANRRKYAEYDVQYFYVVDREEKLAGILRIHDLLFPDRRTQLAKVMISSPLSVSESASLRQLQEFFEEHRLLGVPVLDSAQRLVGVVLPNAVEEAINKRRIKTFLRLSGIIGGEEFRTMPLLSRSGRRLSWLSMNIVHLATPQDQVWQEEVVVAAKNSRTVDWEAVLSSISQKKALEYSADRSIFRQGDPADSVFFLRQGKVKLTVLSKGGKEAIIAVLGDGDLFGEGCLAGQPLRMATAVALSDCSITRLEKSRMVRLLHEQHAISEMFVTHLLSRNIRYEADLVDQLFNSSEKRLARILLILSHFGKESKSEPVLPRISQENLAEMVGTTRSRVSHFMNKFRKLGFVDYGEGDGLTVNSGLLSVVLHD